MNSEWWSWAVQNARTLNWECLSWVAQVLETGVVLVLAPIAVWQFRLQRKATKDQTQALLLQTIATVISWVQAEPVRESRRLLFDLDRTGRISQLPISEWEEDWKQAADRVSQAFNSAAIVAREDPGLQKIWIRPSREAIRESWRIAQPRIRERRTHVPDLWQEFDWLAKKAQE